MGALAEIEPGHVVWKAPGVTDLRGGRVGVKARLPRIWLVTISVESKLAVWLAISTAVPCWWLRM